MHWKSNFLYPSIKSHTKVNLYSLKNLTYSLKKINLPFIIDYNNHLLYSKNLKQFQPQVTSLKI